MISTITRQNKRALFEAKYQTLTSIEYYPFKHETPRAIPKILASEIMHENSDPRFLRSDVVFCKLVSFWATCMVIIEQWKLVQQKVRKSQHIMLKHRVCVTVIHGIGKEKEIWKDY